MSLYRQLPVYSPISAAALLQGAAATLAGSAKAERAIRAWLAREYGSGQVHLTDSGTSALALALRASVNATSRPVVALPAYGCYDLVTAAMAAAVRVRFYDVDPATLGPEWSSLGGALSSDTAAVVIVHQYGIPVDLARVRSLADQAGALLVEDAAQGTGGSLAGRPLGAGGDFGILSFGRGKGMTSGGGGAILANTPAALQAIGGVELPVRPGSRGGKLLLETGVQWLLARPAWYGIPSAIPWLKLGETVFRPPHEARGMSASSKGILSRTLGYVARESMIRRQHALRLGAPAAAVGKVPSGAKGEAGFLRLPVIVEDTLRPAFHSAAARSMGIMPGYPRPLTDLPVEAEGSDVPGARQLAQSLFTLPTHSYLSERELRKIESWLVQLAENESDRGSIVLRKS